MGARASDTTPALHGAGRIEQAEVSALKVHVWYIIRKADVGKCQKRVSWARAELERAEAALEAAKAVGAP
jgi:hypothetical protein